MSFYYSIPLVVTAELAEAQRLLGKEILRILDYYQEDGAKSIAQIEQALANGDPSSMVLPAHTLKGESRQFGAARLGDIAEAIENAARSCVEHHRKPDEVAVEVAMLRGCFTETLLAFGRTAPEIPNLPPPSPAASLRSIPLSRSSRTFGRRAAE
jgi:HPt (histidine-containing phosphotransfer) domain-containing protein